MKTLSPEIPKMALRVENLLFLTSSRAVLEMRAFLSSGDMAGSTPVSAIATRTTLIDPPSTASSTILTELVPRSTPRTRLSARIRIP